MTAVLLDVRRATWRPGLGISRYATSLVREILTIDPADIDLKVIDLKDSPWPSSMVVSVPGGTKMVDRALQEQLAIPRLSRRADVLHLPWYEGPARSSCPLILTVHDLDTLENPQGYRWRFRAYYNSLLRLQARQAVRIVVPSEATREAVALRWPRAQTALIPYGVDEVFRSSEPGPTRSDPPAILYTGGYDYRKRVEDLLQAFEIVATRDPEVRLILTGQPSHSLQQMLESKDARRRVHLTGFVSDERLAELYRRASLVVYPSLLEGFGFPVLEAFASGTPVVATRSGSIPEVAGGAASLVNPCQPGELADAMSEVLSNSDVADDLAARGRERARQFSWAQTAWLTLDLYRSVA